MTSKPKKKAQLSKTEHYILGLLARPKEEDPGTGNPSEWIKLSPSQMIEKDGKEILNRNTVYAIVARMVLKDFLKSEHEKKSPGQKGRPRRFFYPTDEGIEAYLFYNWEQEGRPGFKELAQQMK